MKILAQILATLTQHNRRQVVLGRNFEWSNKSWTHNVFRVYELIFWRRDGIKAELTSYLKDGKMVYQCHSFESVFAVAETYIRNTLAFKFAIPVRVWIPIYSNPLGLPIPASPYLFAIAFDVATTSTAGTDTGKTTSHTCTGSNLVLVSHGFINTNVGYSGMTYAGTAMTIVNSVFLSGTGRVEPWILVNPATGANNIVTSIASNFNENIGTSYSGCKQTGQPDANTTNSGSTGTTLTTSLTTIADNCWTILCAGTAGAGQTAGTGTTRRAIGANVALAAFDSNAAITPAGSTNLATVDTTDGTGQIHVMFSLSPAAAGGATVTPLITLPLLGVG